MSKPPGVASAFVVSVLVHVILFAALALMPGTQRALASKTEPEAPLEVAFQAASEAAALPPPGRLAAAQPQPQHFKPADRAAEIAELPGPYDSAKGTPKQGSGANSAAAADAARTPFPAPAPSANAPGFSVVPAQPSASDKGGVPDGTGNDEEPSVEASGYKGAVNEAIGASRDHLWKSLPDAVKKSLSFGTIDTEFYLDATGAVSDIRVLSNDTGNPQNEAQAIRVIRETRFPPIPPGVLEHLAGNPKRFKRWFTFNVYPSP